MAIQELRIRNGKMHQSASINFNKGNIATIVGLNGHGKSKLIDSIIDKNSVNFLTGDNTNLEFKFEIGEEELNEFKDFAIFKIDSRFTTIKNRSAEFIVSDNWQETLKNLNNALVAYFNERLFKQSKALDDDPEAVIHKECVSFNEIAEQNKDAYLWYWIIGAIRQITSLRLDLENSQVLNQTLSQMQNWHYKMTNVIKVRKIDYSTPIPNGYIYFKSEAEGLNIPQMRSQNQQWIVSLFSAFGHLKKLANFSNFNSDAKISKICEELTKQINDILNQPSLEIRINLSIYSGTIISFSFSFFEGSSAVNWNDLSSGTQRLLSIILKMGEVNENTIVCLDEPDANLHPAIQSDLRNKLEKLTYEHKCRFIITTHSIYMLNLLNNYVNTYVSIKTGAGRAELKTITDYNRSIKDTNGIQIWNLLGYQREAERNFNNKDKVIIVEGESDVIYIKKFAEILKINIDEWRITPGYGNTQMASQAININKVFDVKKENIFCLFDKIDEASGDEKLKKEKMIKWLESENIRHGFTVFLNIEDVFEGSDVQKYVCKYENKYTQKLIKAHEFSLIANNENIDQKTRENISNIMKMLPMYK